MADTKITDLTAASSADNSSLIEIVISGVSYKISKENFYKGIVNLITQTSDTDTILDIKNFSRQGLGGEPTAVIVHHYTDGHLMQLDNVGTGDILRLVNAQNATHRSDEASDYVGTGNFLKLITTPVGVGSSQETLMYIDENGQYQYPRSSDYFSVTLNKTPDSNYAFQLLCNNDQVFLFNLDNRFKMLQENATYNGFVSDRGFRFYVSDSTVAVTMTTTLIDNKLQTRLSTCPTYADDSAAGTGGLSAGDIYKTSTGELRIKL